MAFISVTRLRLRAWRFMPGTAFHMSRTVRQVKRAPGFCGGALLADRHLAFWTATIWETEAHMRDYRGAAAHRAAMPHLLDWCDESSVTHWEQPNELFPSWAEAEARMRSTGRPSKLRFPSPAHESLGFPPPRLTAGVNIAPAAKPKSP